MVLEQLIQNSIFLSSAHKVVLLERIKSSDESYKEKLKKILLKEEDMMKEFLEGYVQKAWPQGLAQLRGSMGSYEIQIIREMEKNDIAD